MYKSTLSNALLPPEADISPLGPKVKTKCQIQTTLISNTKTGRGIYRMMVYAKIVWHVKSSLLSEGSGNTSNVISGHQICRQQKELISMLRKKLLHVLFGL